VFQAVVSEEITFNTNSAVEVLFSSQNTTTWIIDDHSRIVTVDTHSSVNVVHENERVRIVNRTQNGYLHAFGIFRLGLTPGKRICKDEERGVNAKKKNEKIIRFTN